jgi:hypothetical protein
LPPQHPEQQRRNEVELPLDGKRPRRPDNRPARLGKEHWRRQALQQADVQHGLLHRMRFDSGDRRGV